MINKVVKKKKKLGSMRGGDSGTHGGSDKRPRFVEKIPPCTDRCPNHNKIREALMVVSRAEEQGKTQDKAYEEAWQYFMERSPFPAVCGRVCPHPCETQCNRKDKDGAVSINSFERFLGDYGLEKGLKPVKLSAEQRAEKIAVVGSGPAGMSCAYQLARRGYPVTVFEALPKTGGMLRYGIPDYRLPQSVLDGEVQRIADMGVEIKCGTAVGKDVAMDDLRKEYKAVFVGIGGHQGLKLRCEGEDAENVYTGTSFLRRVNLGEKVDVGDKVVVVGGGDTAIDAARIARRLGAETTILYRRTKDEMPAIDEEIEGALEEDVKIHFLAAPLSIVKSNGKATGMKCQKMELGEPDASGRRRPVPIEGDTFDLEFTTLIAAISQEPDFTGLESLREGRDWVKVDEKYKTKEDGVYSGGDNINLGLVVDAIHHGRLAAEAIHQHLTGETPAAAARAEVVKKVRLEHYEEKKRAAVKELAVADRMGDLSVEIASTLSGEEALGEAKRCMSCGMCFHCGNCWSFCQDNAVLKPMSKSEPYKFKLEFCKGCSKCADMCPCGYIDMQ
ncbi:MAG: NAD(P)-binding protein [Elusimicrobiota bacterium]